MYYYSIWLVGLRETWEALLIMISVLAKIWASVSHVEVCRDLLLDYPSCSEQIILMNYMESNSCDPCNRTSALARHACQPLLLNAFRHSMDGPHYGMHCTFCLWIILCEILGEDFCSMSKLIFWSSIMVKWLTGLFNLTGRFFFFF